jgi:CheY-like chemotaxis protein
MVDSCRRSARSSESPSNEQPLVLVVDYSEDNGELYATYFEHLGYRVARVGGVNRTRRLLSLSPAAIVIDLAGLSLNECDIARQLRAASLEELVIVAVSSHSSDAELNWSDEQGPDVVLAKPCVPSVVARHVRARLEAANRSVSGYPKPMPDAAPKSEGPRSKRTRPVDRKDRTAVSCRSSVTPAYSRAKTLARDEAARRRSRA